MSYQINFPSVDSFCFNEIVVHFPNKSDQFRFASIKREHTHTIQELLSEYYLNNPTDIIYRLGLTKIALQDLWVKVDKLNSRYNYKPLSSILNKIDKNIDFVGLLWSYFANRFPSTYNSTYGDEEFKKLGNLIRNLDVSNENQMMAFHNLPIGEIYHQQIVLVSNFTLNRDSKQPSAFKITSTLYYDVVLPFLDKNYDESSTDCTQKRNLPLFFQVNVKVRPVKLNKDRHYSNIKSFTMVYWSTLAFIFILIIIYLTFFDNAETKRSQSSEKVKLKNAECQPDTSINKQLKSDFHLWT